MKIVAISGSYRKGKTIDTLVDKAAEGINQVDPLVEIEKISNGWLIIEEKRIKTKNGFPDFESKKTYVQENPVKNIQIPK